MLSSMRTSQDDATRRECSASFVRGASYPSNTTRAYTASSFTGCIAHRYVLRLLAAAKQHDVEDDPRQWCTLHHMVGGCRWVPSHLAL